MKTEKRIQAIVNKTVDKLFTEEEQDKIEWYVDEETEWKRICRGVFEGQHFEIHVDKVSGFARHIKK